VPDNVARVAHHVAVQQHHAIPSPALPGSDLVSAGLADLRAGRSSEASLLVDAAATRLRDLGYEVPMSTLSDPEGDLYEMIRRRVGDARAHGTYNALRRRIASFLRASPRDTTG
jgi:hypothetical protein